MEIVAQTGVRAGELPLARRQMGKMAKAALSPLPPMGTVTASMDMEVEQLMVAILDDETVGSTSGCRSDFCIRDDETNTDALEVEDADLIDELGAALFDDDQDFVLCAGQSVNHTVVPAVGESAVAVGVGTGRGLVKDNKRKCDKVDSSEASQPGYWLSDQATSGTSADGGVDWAPAATAEEVRRQMTNKYRRTVAIPRYLRKKANRNWSKKAMYETRTKAAQARSRVNGKFVVSDDSEPGFYFV